MFKFQGSITDKTDQKPLNNFVVDVYEGNNIIQSPEADKKGRFEASLFGGGEYIIDIYLDGYYPKRIIVKTDVPAGIKKVPLFKFEAELVRKSDYELIEKVDIFATSIFDFPYVIFEWDAKAEDFGYNKDYTQRIKALYDEVSELR
jgi:hypothetical protein